ncbi:hypothetical protein A4X13_0g8037 [Tilletia indica]|uniref:Reverse transcriptase domain-containing protein n=1 Tax=Tilletia indica TaxID=43049 RepID=A0A8T8SGA0_9BASI|nr:hypothetical protein A4X13_0g8037 [Tilletia indica]
MSKRLLRFARHPRFAPTASDHHAVAISLALDIAFTPTPDRHDRPWTLHPGLLHDPQFRSSVLAAAAEIGPPTPTSSPQNRITQWQDYICRLRDVCRATSIPAGQRLKALRNSVGALERQIKSLSLTDERDLRQLPTLLAHLQSARRMTIEATTISTVSRRTAHAFHPTSWLETSSARTGGSHSIRSLRAADGSVTSDPDRMLHIVHAFFSDLYSVPGPSPIHDWGRDLLRAHALTRFLPDDVQALDSPFSLEEVTLALRHANAASSPGPLGLTYPLLSLTEETTGPHLLNLAEGLRDGATMPVLLQTSLLHKKGLKVDLSTYRPISVSDTALRTVTRMAARRLQIAAGNAMPWTQAAFMPGRRTSSIAGALQGILDHLGMGRDPSLQSIVVLLLDQQKAYDRVGHTWLWDVLRDAGSPASFTRLVQALYSDPSLQVMVNGRLTDLVHLHAGLLQGDSLSCALYNMSLQPLQDLLAALRVGIHVEGLGLVTSLAFADDLAILLPGNAAGAAQWPLIMSALQAYEAASGARLNRNKSGFFEASTDLGAGSAPLRSLMAADGFVELPTSNNEIIHLGHPIHFMGPAGPCRLAFDARIEAMGTRADQLQKANTDLILRTRLCNSLLTPKPWHHSSVGGLPPTARSLISGATHTYLFLGDRPWFSTDTLSAPRHLGGLGLIHPDHMFTAQSIAFLAHNLTREDVYGEWLRRGLGWHLHHEFKCCPAALLIPGGTHRKVLKQLETRALGFWGRLLHALASVDLTLDDSWLSLGTPALLELPWYLDALTPPLPASWTAKDFSSLATRGWITWGDILWKASNTPRAQTYSPSWPLSPPSKASAASNHTARPGASPDIKGPGMGRIFEPYWRSLPLGLRVKLMASQTAAFVPTEDPTLQRQRVRDPTAAAFPWHLLRIGGRSWADTSTKKTRRDLNRTIPITVEWPTSSPTPSDPTLWGRAWTELHSCPLPSAAIADCFLWMHQRTWLGTRDFKPLPCPIPDCTEKDGPTHSFIQCPWARVLWVAALPLLRALGVQDPITWDPLLTALGWPDIRHHRPRLVLWRTVVIHLITKTRYPAIRRCIQGGPFSLPPTSAEDFRAAVYKTLAESISSAWAQLRARAHPHDEWSIKLFHRTWLNDSSMVRADGLCPPQLLFSFPAS